MNAKSVATQGFQARFARVIVRELGQPRTVAASGADSNNSYAAKPEEPSHVQHNCAHRQRASPTVGAS